MLNSYFVRISDNKDHEGNREYRNETREDRRIDGNLALNPTLPNRVKSLARVADASPDHPSTPRQPTIASPRG